VRINRLGPQLLQLPWDEVVRARAESLPPTETVVMTVKKIKNEENRSAKIKTEVGVGSMY
jgi:hypothetical protein